MYKTKLQELCHRKRWNGPEYAATREGPDHNPRFKASVSLNGVVFHTSSLSKSAKEAQNAAAKLAFDHFSLPTSSPIPPTHDSAGASGGTVQSKVEEICQSPQVDGTGLGAKDDGRFKVIQLMYKNQLQTFAQKRNISLPVYSCEREGPPHASRFKCKVTIDGQIYESVEYFPTLKEAEHAVAKVALMSLSANGIEEAIHLKDDSGFYKNILQELAQREGYSLPAYTTNQFGEVHIPLFVSTVEIGGETFTGQEGKTKKQAEMNAAKVAYTTLKDRNSSKSPLILSRAKSPSILSPTKSPLILSPACQRQEILDLSSSSVQTHGNAVMQRNVRANAPVNLNIGNSNASHLILSPARQRQEVLESSPSSVQSNGNANLQNIVRTKAPASLNIVNSEFGRLHLDIQSSGPETFTSDNDQPSDSFTNMLMDSTAKLPAVHPHTSGIEPETVTSDKDLSVDDHPSDCFANIVMAAKLPAGKSKVIVHPHTPNMKLKFPVGSKLVREENWVAVKLGPDSNN